MRLDNGERVLWASKNEYGFTWEQVEWAEADLPGLTCVPLQLQLVDTYHGGWGFVGLDSVALTNAQPCQASDFPTAAPQASRPSALKQHIAMAASTLRSLPSQQVCGGARAGPGPPVHWGFPQPPPPPSRDHAPVTRGRMRAQYPLPHGPLSRAIALLHVDLTRRGETGTVMGLRWHSLPFERKGEWEGRIGQAGGGRALGG